MCLEPTNIPERGFVACRKCWQCRERKIDDWVGRNIAESLTAKRSTVISLTYGRDRSTNSPDHLRSVVLTYSDVQKMLKYLRVEGYPVRYFVVGEYGSTKGRAHWHIIVYWQDRVPAFELEKEMYLWKYWTHGFAYFKDGTSQAAIRYACKYLTMDITDEAAQIFGPMPSKRPPLGDAYFRRLAQQYVDAALAPQDLFYSFPDVCRVPRGSRANSRKGLMEKAKPIRFHMTGKTAENFCRYYVEAWENTYPGTVHPASQMLLDNHADYQSSPVPWTKMPDLNNAPVWGRDEDGWRWQKKTARAVKNYLEFNPTENIGVAYYGPEKPQRPSNEARDPATVLKDRIKRSARLFGQSAGISRRQSSRKKPTTPATD